LGNQVIRVCFLSQESGLADAIARALGEEFLASTAKELPADALADGREWCDVIVLDLRSAIMPDEEDDAIRLLDEINTYPSHPPVVVLCQDENRRLFLKAIERGAYDSVTNPPNIDELRLVLRRARKLHAAERELQSLRANARTAGSLHELLGTSAPMQELFALVRKIAPCDVNVLITGETGTGKELLARAIHHLSARSAGPLVAFSCANLPETLVEDELFGHERGAFTGALMGRRGRLESADRGTLFLDEIGDLGVGLQPKLLRVIQERNFERLGSNKTINVDIRLICATNRNLADMLGQGKFRDDLFYRLNVVQMHLPPLRERRDDIPLLAQQFLQRSAQQFRKRAVRFSQPVLCAMEEYAWPGNVRELENVVQRAVALSEDQTVDISHMPVSMRSGSDALCTTPPCEGTQLALSYELEIRRFKRGLVLRALRKCGWRKAESARALGVARGYLHRLINQLEIQEGEVEAHSESEAKFPSAGRVN